MSSEPRWGRPQSFGKYELLDRIGSGGMAEVYLARSFGAEGLEKQLVIKKILPAFANKPRFISMFIDEAKIAVSLNHPNIVQVYDFGRVGEDYYLAMEHVDGTDLGRLLTQVQSVGPFPLGEAIHLAIELCKGLDYAHRRTDQYGDALNLVHRDISPQNLLISKEGDLKIVDFGIAHARTVTTEMVGMIKGKYSYMSPEQATGARVDARSDLFSALIVLFEMLFGRALFPYTTIEETLSLVRSAVLPDFRDLTPSIPEELEHIFFQGLSRNPTKRFANARELQVALHRVLMSTGELHDAQTVAAFVDELATAAPKPKTPDEVATVLHGGEVGLSIGPHAQHRTPPIPPTQSSLTSGELTPASLGAHHDVIATGEIRRTKKDFVCVCGELSGFNELHAQGLHDQRQGLLLELNRIIEAIAFKNKAIVERFSESGFLILLGLPASAENDAERAVWMSTDLLEAVAGINLNLETPIHVSIGIALGRALISQATGRRGYEKTLLGHIIDLSQRMASEAMPREILVGGRIYQRVRRSFELAFLKQIPFEEDERYGLSNPSIYRVLQPKTRKTRQTELRQSYNVVHGRELQLKALRERFQRVQIERIGLGFALSGDVGLGKSAIVDEFLRGIEGQLLTQNQAAATSATPSPPVQPDAAAEDVWAEPTLILRALPSPNESDTPYATIRELIADLVELEPENDIRTIKSTIDAMVVRYFSNEDSIEQNFITQALGFFFDVKYKSSSIERLSSQQRRSRILLSVRRCLEAVTPRRPIIIVIEDVHQCDTASTELLADLFLEMQRSPIFFVLTTRPVSEPPAAVERLLGHPSMYVEELRELSSHHAAAVVRERLGDLEIDQVALDYILERSGGVPFFIRELVDALKARRVLTLVNGRYTLGGAANETWLPTSLEAVIAARIDSLEQAPKETLRVCSILGPEFEESDAVLLFGDAIPANLERLEQLGWLLRVRSGHRSFRFAHTLTYEVAFRELLWEERTEFHARLADYLIEESEAGRRVVDPATIARHLEGADQGELAADYYLRAGRRALQESSHVEALRATNRALKLLPAPHCFAGLMLRETILSALGHHEERLETLNELHRLAKEHLDDEKLLHVLNRFAHYWTDRREFERALPFVEEVIARADVTEQQAALARARQIKATIVRETGDTELAIQLYGEALMGFNAADDDVSAAHVVKSIGDTYWQMGRFRDALEAYDEAIANSEEGADLREVVYINAGLVYVSMCDYEKGLRRYTDALESCRRTGFQRREAAILPNLGHLYMLIGEPTRAERVLQRAIQLAKRLRDRLVLADATLTLGVVYLELENYVKAEETLRRGHRLAVDTDVHYLIIHSELAFARLRLAGATAQSLEQAESYARSAIAHGEAASMMHGVSHGKHLLSLIMEKMGEYAAAAELGEQALQLVSHDQVFDEAPVLFEQAQRILRADPSRGREAHELIVRAAQHVESVAEKFEDSTRRNRYLARRLHRSILNARERGASSS